MFNLLCDSKFDLQFLSQCGSTYNCLSTFTPEIHQHVVGTLSNQQATTAHTNKTGRCSNTHHNIIQSLFIQFCFGCFTSTQHASISKGLIFSDNSTCCHTETKVVAQTVYLTLSQYTAIEPTSSRAHSITPGA